MEYHSGLNKQIRKLLPESYLKDKAMLAFFESVSNYYSSIDKAQRLSEHAFTVSEREYQEANSNLLRENEIKQKSISEIKKAIGSLAPDSITDLGASDDDLITIIKFLQQEIGKAKELEHQLIVSKDIAEKAALSKSQFLSTMSHEIRTPMNAVIGFTHLLLQMNPREDQLEYLKMMKFSAENLLVLINDILDFSKIEAGKIEFEEADFSIKQLIGNIRMALLQKATEKDIALIQDLARRSWESAYAEILSAEQIEYMLTTMYSEKEIRGHLQNPDYHYYLIFNESDHSFKGFLGYENRYEQGTTKLHRIYLVPESKGRGIGKQALDFLKRMVSETQDSRIVLNVNKENKAMKFYESQGFTVYKEIVVDIGKGFVMDDYEMEFHIVSK